MSIIMSSIVDVRIEEMLAARGIIVSHETVRQWALSSAAIRQPDPPAATGAGTNGTSMRSSSRSPG